MTSSEEERLPILQALQVDSSAYLGQGGEAAVYALDADRIARIYHRGARAEIVEARRALLDELAPSTGRVPFARPAVLEVLTIGDRLVTVERRLPGRSLGQVLGETTGPARRRLVHAYLEAASQIGELTVRRPWYGDIIRPEPIRSRTFGEYLLKRAQASLAVVGGDFAKVDPAALAGDLPEPDQPSLVHLDAYPGNMLVEGTTVTAVIDFGVVTIVGDRRLDVLAAAVYLTPLITPGATDDDRASAKQWLADHDLLSLYKPVKRWLAAFWSFAHDDLSLFQWCQSILLG